jgi:hypothetical protein
MLYELARDVISAKIGNISHEIGLEEAKPEPSHERIAELEAQIVAFARERECLDPEDEISVRQLLQRYARSPISTLLSAG